MATGAFASGFRQKQELGVDFSNPVKSGGIGQLGKVFP
jgi:hypothetical protein